MKFRSYIGENTPVLVTVDIVAPQSAVLHGAMMCGPCDGRVDIVSVNMLDADLDAPPSDDIQESLNEATLERFREEATGPQEVRDAIG